MNQPCMIGASYGDAKSRKRGLSAAFVAALERALGEGESAAVGSVFRAFTECSTETMTCRPKAVPGDIG